MIATRLSPVWQVAGVAFAALICYLVSQSVASERAALAKVDRQIASEQDAIAKLSTEIATRSRLTQIESWNRQLALQAPRPGQYVENGVQLASLYAHDSRPQIQLDPNIVPPRGPIQQVSLPATPAPTASVPAAPKPAPVPLPAPPVAKAPALPARPVIEEAAFHPAARPKVVKASAAAHTDPTPAPEPLLHNAAYLRPQASRLDDAAGPATTTVSFHLSADIAGLAKAEQAKHHGAGKAK